MQIFYVTDLDGDSCTLDETESRHCARVLRMSKGDRVNLIDGKGVFCEGLITDPDPRACMIRITDRKEEFEKRAYKVGE